MTLTAAGIFLVVCGISLVRRTNRGRRAAPVVAESTRPSDTAGAARRQGFTLIELLIVIAILGLLMALTVSGVQAVRHASARVECANNLRQIGIALHQYHDGNGVFPPGVSYRDGKDPYPFMSWSARLLPFLEQEPLWKTTLKAFAENKHFLDDPPHVGLGTILRVYTCPSDGRTRSVAVFGIRKIALTSYLGMEGTNQFRGDGTLFLDSRVRIADITDGTSNTLLVGERPPSTFLNLGWWYAAQGQEDDGSADVVLGVRERFMDTSSWSRGCPPGPYQFGPGRVDNKCDAFHYWSLHSGGTHFLTADGAVHFLRYAAVNVLDALATRAGHEAATLPD